MEVARASTSNPERERGSEPQMSKAHATSCPCTVHIGLPPPGPTIDSALLRIGAFSAPVSPVSVTHDFVSDEDELMNVSLDSLLLHSSLLHSACNEVIANVITCKSYQRGLRFPSFLLRYASTSYAVEPGTFECSGSGGSTCGCTPQRRELLVVVAPAAPPTHPLCVILMKSTDEFCKTMQNLASVTRTRAHTHTHTHTCLLRNLTQLHESHFAIEATNSFSRMLSKFTATTS